MFSLFLPETSSNLFNVLLFRESILLIKSPNTWLEALKLLQSTIALGDLSVALGLE